MSGARIDMPGAGSGTTVLRAGGLSVRLPRRALVAGAGCALVALIAALFAIGSGDYPMTPGAVLRTLGGGGSVAETFIVREIRLPRAVTALLTGAALGLSGAVFQSLSRNPLGSPDVLGFTHGASTGALLVIIVAGAGSVAVAAGAAVGGIATGALIYVLAGRHGLHGYRLVLVGIGMWAVLSGVNGYLLTRTEITDAARAVLWLTGSLAGRGWNDAWPLLAAILVAAPVVLIAGPAMRTVELGDDAAHALGVRVHRLRTALLAAAVLLSSFAAAAAGPVAFVALTAPQLARRLTRTPGPNLLPAACMGAALMVVADLAGQRAVPGHQLPVGVLTGVLGGTYLIWLLITERKRNRV
jgi:iron complex transport system permease protein